MCTVTNAYLVELPEVLLCLLVDDDHDPGNGLAHDTAGKGDKEGVRGSSMSRHTLTNSDSLQSYRSIPARVTIWL